LILAWARPPINPSSKEPSYETGLVHRHMMLQLRHFKGLSPAQVWHQQGGQLVEFLAEF